MCSMTTQSFSSIWILTEIIPGAPSNMVCIKRLSEPILCPNFSTSNFVLLLHENCRFCSVYGYLITIMRLRTSKIGIHVAFIYSHVVNKIQFFCFNGTGVSVITKSIKSIFICQNKWPRKIKILIAQIPKYFRHLNSVHFLLSNLALELLFFFKLSKLLFS